MIDPRGRELIKEFEGLRLEAYRCPAGKWTIGYGSTTDVKEFDKITPAEAEARLERDIARCETTINALVFNPITPSMKAALASFVFNLGSAKFKISTLLRKIHARKYEEAAQEFRRWTWATVDGKLTELPGLVRRREKESELFLADGIPE